jgi:hypothetical protein
MALFAEVGVTLTLTGTENETATVAACSNLYQIAIVKMLYA